MESHGNRVGRAAPVTRSSGRYSLSLLYKGLSQASTGLQHSPKLYSTLNRLNELSYRSSSTPRPAIQESSDTAHTMDTDYPLPAPMHRPFLALDPQYDALLPCRRSLKQAIELNAENSIPYQLPRARPLSRLELLPFEIRERIYGYLGVIFGGYHTGTSLAIPDCSKSIEFCSYDAAWHMFTPTTQWIFEYSILYLNHQIRAEVLDLLFRGMSVTFKYHLSDRKIFSNNWHACTHLKPVPLVHCHAYSLCILKTS